MAQIRLNHLVQRVLSVKTSGHTTYSEVKLLNDKNDTIGSATFEYTIRKDGILSVQTRFVPDTTFVSSLARVGLVLKCPTVLIVSLIWAEESMRLMLTENFRAYRYLSY